MTTIINRGSGDEYIKNGIRMAMNGEKSNRSHIWVITLIRGSLLGGIDVGLLCGLHTISSLVHLGGVTSPREAELQKVMMRKK